MKTYKQQSSEVTFRATAMIVIVVALVPALAGCGLQHRPQHRPPLTLRHCAVTREVPGFVGCDCSHPLAVWDAQLKRKVYCCDGKVQ